MKLKLCRECKYSVESKGNFELRCANPYVNAKDSWALSQNSQYAHTHCRSERDGGIFTVCGMRGAKWEPKEAIGGGE